MPADTNFRPSLTMEWARMVAVVVPSPASSDVREATSRTIWAPMFSNLSASSISLATVTPSLVIRGAPNDLSKTTLRPLGPSVTRTAFARISTPRIRRSRASCSNRTSFAAIYSSPSLNCRSDSRRSSNDDLHSKLPIRFTWSKFRPRSARASTFAPQLRPNAGCRPIRSPPP